MKWYFQPHPGGGAERDDDEVSAPGLLGLPAALLQRHGGRALRRPAPECESRYDGRPGRALC